MSERDTDRPPPATRGGAEWPSGPAAPRLTAGVADVWRADLRAVADDVLGSLTDGECERGAGIAGERERMLWSRSRGLLRELLGRYLRCAAADVELAAGTNGKPELAVGAGQPPELFFNLSHSEHLALYAFTADGPVGVDVQARRSERPGATVDHIALARRAFGEHEAQRLSLVAPARREWEFLRAWACHEAELKRLGAGLGGFGARDDKGGSAQADPRSAPWVAELDVGADAAAAVALQRRASELRRWAWA
jgi:phosphopantetheinyl transferase